MTDFWQRLKQRKLVQWALAYVAAAFALLQGVDIVAQRFAWPDSIARGLIIASCVGFFITVLLAWYHGERGEQKVSNTEILIVALLLAMGGGFMWRFAGTGSSESATHGAAIASLAPATKSPLATDVPAKSIAVLPFENLSEDKTNAYFADGIQDEILTRLAKVGQLKVISRTSTEKYKSHPESVREIGQQLQVAHILEGSVQKAGNQVLINVQLIDARTDEHLWAESYKRTLDDIFGVEAEVARIVASELNAQLTLSEQQAVAATLTKNKTAYDVYLRGLTLINKVGSSGDDWVQAARDFSDATQLDPRFAQAWAKLSQIRTWLYATYRQRSSRALRDAKEAADTALALDPMLGEGYVALAQYQYLAVRDLDAALPPLHRARELLPNNADVLTTLAAVEQLQGNWPQASEHLRLAALLDPRGVRRQLQLAQSYVALRQFDRAQEVIDGALVMSPDDQELLGIKAAIFRSEGNLDAAQAVMKGRSATRNNFPILYSAIRLAYLRRDYTRMVSLIEEMQASKDISGNQTWHAASMVQLGAAQKLAGRKKEAQANFEQGLAAIKAVRKSDADDHELAPIFASAYAGLDEKNEALRWARRAVVASSTCSVCKPAAEEILAQIQAQFGDFDAALAVLPRLLKVPNGLNVAILRLDPAWDPLRKDPRFQALIVSHGSHDGRLAACEVTQAAAVGGGFFRV